MHVAARRPCVAAMLPTLFGLESPGQMVMSSRDRVIVEEYAKFDMPADKIPADPSIAVEFLNRVNSRLSPHEQFSQSQLNTHLINLRRRGEANGGLPRLRRSYNGRNN